MNIQIKRIYTAPSPSDGTRILVDRLWPRGLKKEDAKIDFWAKDVTPSNELRKWYHEDMEHRWDEFQRRYQNELNEHHEQLEQLRGMMEDKKVTLLTAAKNELCNHVIILKQLLEK
nr:DUF488 family protein [Acinetobacter sp. Marseille-Q1620]